MTADEHEESDELRLLMVTQERIKRAHQQQRSRPTTLPPWWRPFKRRQYTRAMEFILSVRSSQDDRDLP